MQLWQNKSNIKKIELQHYQMKQQGYLQKLYL